MLGTEEIVDLYHATGEKFCHHQVLAEVQRMARAYVEEGDAQLLGFIRSTIKDITNSVSSQILDDVALMLGADADRRPDVRSATLLVILQSVMSVKCRDVAGQYAKGSLEEAKQSMAQATGFAVELIRVKKELGLQR